MIDGKSILAIIPARGGSKGVPGKNLKNLKGKPLIDHTIDFAKEIDFFNKIVVSSDDEKILDHASKLDVDVIKRPENISQDNSLVIDAIKFTINSLITDHYVPDYIFLLEPTSPIRKKDDFKKALNSLLNNYDSVTTFCEIDPPPNRIWQIENEIPKPLFVEGDPFLPRQKQRPGYKLTGQLYGFSNEIMKDNIRAVLFGKIFPIFVDSKEAIDIDSEMDFLIAEQMMSYNEKTK